MANETMRKKVVLVIFSLQGNGAERFVLTLARGFLSLGLEPHVICFKDVVELPIPDGVRVHIFPYKRYRVLPKLVRKKIAARGLDRFIKIRIGMPQMVLSNLYQVDWVLTESCLDNIYFVIHNTVSKELAHDKLSEMMSIYNGKNCVCVSRGVERDLLGITGGSVNTTVIYNPVDIELARESASVFVPSECDYIVNVGKFKFAKRHDVLIKAYAESGVDNPLVLVGEGPLKQSCNQLVEELGISDKVVFAGFQSNPYPYIKNASLMVVSSEFEGFSVAILEALALGTPIISTDCPSGPDEVLSPHQLVGVNDVAALAEKMKAAINNPGDYVTGLERRYFPDYVANKYLELPEKLIGED